LTHRDVLTNNTGTFWRKQTGSFWPVTSEDWRRQKFTDVDGRGSSFKKA